MRYTEDTRRVICAEDTENSFARKVTAAKAGMPEGYITAYLLGGKRRIMKKRLLALGLSVMMAVSVIACGNSSEDITGESQQQAAYVYVPEYYDWGIEVSDNDWINTYGMSNGYMLGVYGTVDKETYLAKEYMLALNLSDRSLLQIPVELEEENEYISTFTLTEDGTVIAITEEYDYEEDKSFYRLITVDEAGQITQSVDFTALSEEMKDKYGWFYIQNLVVDSEGIVYISCEQEILALNMDGTKAFGIEVGNWIHHMGIMPDGSVYVIYYGNEGSELAVIDKAAKSFGRTYTINGNMSGSFEVSEGNVIYYSDGSAVYKLSLENGKNEEIFRWLDADINGQYVESVVNVDEDTVIAYYRNWNSNEENFVKLTKTDRSLVPEKTTITLAAFYASSSDLQEQIVSFNKANDTYRIELKTYLDTNNMTRAEMENYEQYYKDATTRMLNDITGNNPPDIISLSESDISMETLVGKGALEELTPHLEKAGYSEADFVQGVVDSYKVDGKLYTLPVNFSLSTQLADSAIVGDEPGWTLEEALEILQNLPEGMAFQNYATQQGFVSQYLLYGYNSFIDSTNATCSFDSPEFKAILEMAKSFPKEYQPSDEWVSEPALMARGELLLANVSIYSLENIQEYMAYLGGKDVTFIGMPGVAGNGSLITPYGSMFGICSKSDEKEAAAQFIIDMLTEEYNENDYTWGFPTYMPAFEDYIADTIDVEYMKDEEGNLILDEEGNPISTEGGSSVSYGDWDYTYRPCTQEDADILLELVNGACTIYNYDTDIFSIILEDLEPFFNNQKSVDEVAGIIQNRINLYLSENS